MKTRSGILSGQRVEYFKGNSAIKAVLSPEYAKLKNVPAVTNEEEAERMLHSMLPFAFFLRVERGDAPPAGKDGPAPRPLQVNQMQMFDKDMYYVWLYEGMQLYQKLAGLGLIVALLGLVMFPLWPVFLRRGVYYLSLGVLALFGLLMVIAVIRLIIWLITIVVLPPGIWIFPNLFADVGVIESFIPLWGWDVPPEKKKVKRTKKKGKKHADVSEAAASATTIDDATVDNDADGEAANEGEVGASASVSTESKNYADIN